MKIYFTCFPKISYLYGKIYIIGLKLTKLCFCSKKEDSNDSNLLWSVFYIVPRKSYSRRLFVAQRIFWEWGCCIFLGIIYYFYCIFWIWCQGIWHYQDILKIQTLSLKNSGGNAEKVFLGIILSVKAFDVMILCKVNFMRENTILWCCCH